ncbi:MAG: hypothetical protein AB7F31_06760 [Parachlamydiales bacterium]
MTLGFVQQSGIEEESKPNATDLSRATNNCIWGGAGFFVGLILLTAVPNRMTKLLVAAGTVVWAGLTLAPGVGVHVVNKVRN